MHRLYSIYLYSYPSYSWWGSHLPCLVSAEWWSVHRGPWESCSDRTTESACVLQLLYWVRSCAARSMRLGCEWMIMPSGNAPGKSLQVEFRLLLLFPMGEIWLGIRKLLHLARHYSKYMYVLNTEHVNDIKKC